MALRFFNLPKSKQFKIVTRFYDPQKEAMEEREDRIRRELNETDGDETTTSYGAGIKGKFRKTGKHNNSRSGAEARRKSNMRLIYILIILFALVYFFFK